MFVPQTKVAGSIAVACISHILYLYPPSREALNDKVPGIVDY